MSSSEEKTKEKIVTNIVRIRRIVGKARCVRIVNEFGSFEFDPTKDEFEVPAKVLAGVLRDANMQVVDVIAVAGTEESVVDQLTHVKAVNPNAKRG